MIKKEGFKKVKNNVAETKATENIDWDKIESNMKKVIRNPEKLEIPRLYQIELTNRCNLNCTMCPHSEMERSKKDLTVEQFKTILDNGVRFKQSIELQMFGESTLNENIGEMIQLVRDKGCVPTLSTNAVLLKDNEELCEDLMNLDAVVLSIDGASKETYEKIRGHSFEDIVESVRTFMEVKERTESNIYVAIQLISMAETKEEELKYKDFWAKFEPDEIRIKRLLDSMGGKVKQEEVRKAGKKRLPCLEGFYGVVVRSDGGLSPCCRDLDGTITFGNLLEESIEEAWNSKEAQKFREAHKEGDLSEYPLCQACNEWDLINLRYEPKIALTHFKGADIRKEDLYSEEEL